MAGECLYKQGDLKGALEQYESALGIYLTYPQWMKRVEFPIVSDNASIMQRTRITWGKSTRTFAISTFPANVSLMIGNTDAENARALQTGGEVIKQELRRFNISEIARCTALSLSRRREILGPTAAYDNFTKQLANAVDANPGTRNPFGTAWARLFKGIMLTAMGEDDKAIQVLQSSIQAGNYDHALTPLALLESAKVNFRLGRYDAASLLALESTYSAAYFNQYDVIAEGMELGTACHLITNKNGVYPPLEPAVAWARGGSKPLQSKLYLLAGQCFTERGQPNDAIAMLKSAQKSMLRTDLLNSKQGIEMNYRFAHANIQKGNFAAGLNQLSKALSGTAATSKWLFQIQLSDLLVTSGRLTPTRAVKLFEVLLREPTSRDWISQPVESLTYISHPNLIVREKWFNILLSRREYERALELADNIRRHRFYSALPIGGRIMAFRWMLESDPDSLNVEQKNARQAFLTKYPLYQTLSKQSQRIQEQLREMPVAPEKESEHYVPQKKLLESLAKVASAQEVLLADVALRREASFFSFPPKLVFSDMQGQMSDKQATLAFLQTTAGIHSFLVTKDNFGYQQLTNGRQFKQQLAALLRELGHYDKNAAVKSSLLVDTEWKTTAAKITQLLIPKIKSEFLEKHEELVIVPDGLVWYMPMEILQLGEGEKQKSVFDLIKTRYAPTVSTSLPDQRPFKVEGNSAIVTGKLFPKDKLEVSDGYFTALKETNPNAFKVPFKIPGPSNVYSSLFDRLMVWDDLEETGGKSGPFNWSALQIDKGRPGSEIQSWMGLPWAGPQQVILPGYHSAASYGLKKGGTGHEMFMTVCGMMSSGTQTILMSRWRTGGKSAYQLTTDLMHDMKEYGPSNAWRDAVTTLHDSEIAMDDEPRVKKHENVENLDLKHPFYWSGYMLIDSGAEPAK